jgi:uncharacterized protein
MISENQILTFLETNKSYLFDNFNITKIGIFGSFAKGTQNNKSDLDLLVEFKPGTKDLFESKQRIRNYIETNLNIKVDICREKYLKKIFKEKILTDAIYI